MSNPVPSTSFRPPRAVQIAASVLALYGVGVLINAAIQQAAIGWDTVEARGFGRATIRFGGMVLVAWGLWKGARWARWIGVVLPAFFLLAGGAAFLVFLRFRNNVPEGFTIPSLPFMIVSIVALTVAVVLLLLPQSRRAFKRPAAQKALEPPGSGANSSNAMK